MTGNRNDNFLLPTPWTDAFKIVYTGHMLGLVACGAALAASQAGAPAFAWLEIAAVRFASGIVSSVFAFISDLLGWLLSR